MQNATKKSVLIVDDESLVRRALKKAFQMKGFQVFEAPGGVEGLKLWEQERPNCVVLDILMPDMNGFEVLKSAQAQGLVSCFVVLISAFSEVKIEDSGVSWPGLELRSKPFEDVFKIVQLCEDKLIE